MIPANDTRRSVMLIAWDAKRAEPARPFGDCLRGAWKLIKRLSGPRSWLTAKAKGAKVLQLSPSLIRSPMERTTRRERYARRADFAAAYTTAVVGA